MTNLLTKSEYNRLRAKRRWSKVSKAKRKKMMSELAKKRWAKHKKLSTSKALRSSSHSDKMKSDGETTARK